ncbi:hypothetical protein [Sphingomonas ginsenosidimutans]|uniref:hypothetical protein n=1 Tax=Sphingomonas ginsenosidimutans TaxID=862134 RepID=UPI001FEC86B0|nr:hypothetical protein [Sphingomonas ginsenosidimutans]
MRSARPSGGPFAFERYRKNPRQIAAHVDLKLAILRCQDDLAHQRAQHISRHHPLGFRILLERRIQFIDLDVIVMRHVRVQEGRRFLGLLQERLQLLLAAFQVLHLLHHAGGRVIAARRHDELHELIQLSVDPFDLGLGRIDRGTAFHAQPIHLARELVTELLEQRRVHQVVA